MCKSNTNWEPSITEHTDSVSVGDTCMQTYEHMTLINASWLEPKPKRPMRTFFISGCGDASEAADDEVLCCCIILCGSSQSATGSTRSWDSSWQTLHPTGLLVRVTGRSDLKVTVISLEQLAWRCPTCNKQPEKLSWSHSTNSTRPGHRLTSK